MGAGGVVAGERPLRRRGEAARHSMRSRNAATLRWASVRGDRMAELEVADRIAAAGPQLTAAERRCPGRVERPISSPSAPSLIWHRSPSRRGDRRPPRRQARIRRLHALQSSVQVDLSRQLRPAAERIRAAGRPAAGRAPPGDHDRQRRRDDRQRQPRRVRRRDRAAQRPAAARPGARRRGRARRRHAVRPRPRCCRDGVAEVHAQRRRRAPPARPHRRDGDARRH